MSDTQNEIRMCRFWVERISVCLNSLPEGYEAFGWFSRLLSLNIASFFNYPHQVIINLKLKACHIAVHSLSSFSCCQLCEIPVGENALNSEVLPTLWEGWTPDTKDSLKSWSCYSIIIRLHHIASFSQTKNTWRHPELFCMCSCWYRQNL